MPCSEYCKISRTLVDSSNWPLAGEQRWRLTSVSLFEVGPRVSAASSGDTGERRGLGLTLSPAALTAVWPRCCRLLQAAAASHCTLLRQAATWIWVTSHSDTSTHQPHQPHSSITLWSQDNNGGRTKELFITLTKKYDF